MKTRIQNLLLLLFLLGLPATVQAQDAYSTNADGSIYTYSTNADGSANIVAYAGPPWVVTIPTNINGLTVTSIGTNTFENNTNLTSVTIPGSVTSIGVQAFANCTSLTNATIGSGVTNIGAEAFYKCKRLTSVTIPGSVISIGPDAFFFCTRLHTATIENGVNSIGPDAFWECGLTSVTIPGSVTSIGEGAFANCTSLTNATIDNGVTSIGEIAFSGTGMPSVTIPESVISIGEEAFDDCDYLTAITVNINNPAYSSLNGVLFNKSQTTIIQYPGGLGGNYYSGLGGSYTIPDSVTSIGAAAFANCFNLTNVTIPGSVTNIGVAAFEYDEYLPSVYCTGNAPAADWSVFSGENNTPDENNTTVYYLPGTTGWGNFSANTGAPTALWFLPNPLILNREPNFGVQPGGFGFTISWATNASVVVEAATNLANPVWIPVSTNTLTGGTNYFSDPQWTNYPARFYRVQ